MVTIDLSKSIYLVIRLSIYIFIFFHYLIIYFFFQISNDQLVITQIARVVFEAIGKTSSIYTHFYTMKKKL